MTYTIKTNTHEALQTVTPSEESAINYAKECSNKKDHICRVYKNDRLIGMAENGRYHEIND